MLWSLPINSQITWSQCLSMLHQFPDQFDMCCVSRLTFYDRPCCRKTRGRCLLWRRISVNSCPMVAIWIRGDLSCFRLWFSATLLKVFHIFGELLKSKGRNFLKCHISNLFLSFSGCNWCSQDGQWVSFSNQRVLFTDFRIGSFLAHGKSLRDFGFGCQKRFHRFSPGFRGFSPGFRGFHRFSPGFRDFQIRRFFSFSPEYFGASMSGVGDYSRKFHSGLRGSWMYFCTGQWVAIFLLWV